MRPLCSKTEKRGIKTRNMLRKPEDNIYFYYDIT